jgi:hypothetical protein
VYYRHDTGNDIVEAVLLRSMDKGKRNVPWVLKTGEGYFGKGKHSFSMRFVCAGDMKDSDMHRLAIEREQPMVVVPRYGVSGGTGQRRRSFMNIGGIVVTAVYAVGDDMVVRGFEADGKETGDSIGSRRGA